MQMSDRLPEAPPGSRLEEVSRRAFLRGGATVIGLTAVGGLAACGGGGSGDQALASTTSTTAATSTTSATSTTATADESAGAVPAAAKLAVSFTYTPSGVGGRVNNPYIAVWVEDKGGELVRALAVWYEAAKSRYLSELAEWSTTSGSSAALTAVSGATRTPGGYQLLWDGTNLSGTRVAPGAYFVCIESAREHGPHSLIRTSLTLGDQPQKLALPSDGELSDANATYSVT
ncbi:MAG: DUF2271 domain-containing protein [Acidimicrobiia bacterium]|nr:DUF2271 domain-containing protein [Acidimicrobiia bacterium]